MTVEVSDGVLPAPDAYGRCYRRERDASHGRCTNRCDENVANGTVVTTVTGTDVDGDVLTYSIVSGNEAGHFSLNANTGTLFVASDIDFETTQSYTLTVRVSDGSLTASAAVEISVNDLPEAPRFTSTPAQRIAQGEPYEYQVSTTDEDANTQLTILAIEKPDWLNLTDFGDGRAELVGVQITMMWVSMTFTCRYAMVTPLRAVLSPINTLKCGLLTSMTGLRSRVFRWR